MKKGLTSIKSYGIITKSSGGIAQLARAIGSYPIGRGFKSNFRYHSGPLVKRLRHRPFTAVTGVRFSHGSFKSTCNCRCFFHIIIPSKSQLKLFN